MKNSVAACTADDYSAQAIPMHLKAGISLVQFYSFTLKVTSAFKKVKTIAFNFTHISTVVNCTIGEFVLCSGKGA